MNKNNNEIKAHVSFFYREEGSPEGGETSSRSHLGFPPTCLGGVFIAFTDKLIAVRNRIRILFGNGGFDHSTMEAIWGTCVGRSCS